MITEIMNNMFYTFMYVFCIICFQAFVLIIWFQSDIVKTLSKIKFLNKLFKYDDYLKMESSVAATFLDYPAYLGVTYNNPLAKLLSCPICINFWMTVFFCLCFYSHFWPVGFVVYIFSMLLFTSIKKNL